jgi:hypothetical protein
MWGVVCAVGGATGAVLGSATGVVVDATGALLLPDGDCGRGSAGVDARGVSERRSLAVSFLCLTGSGVGARDKARDRVSEVRSLAVSFLSFIASGVGTGDEARDGVGEEVSDVRRPRSLMVSFTGFTGSGGGVGMLDCCESIGPFDSSDELSVPSGVASESKSGRGERRFRARRCWSSESPSTLGLGRFLEKVSGTQ